MTTTDPLPPEALTWLAVRPGENLRLPFQLLAWRAWVNHDELTEPVSMPESGIEIDMQVATPLR